MAIVFRKKPFSIVEIVLPRPNRDELFQALKRGDWGRRGTHPNVEKLSKAITGYFRGKIDPAKLPPWEWLDMTGFTNLQQSVLFATAAIPYGKVSTYKHIAEAVFRPRASRFVGTTLANNPYPLLIPCHRVIRSDKTVGQYGGGTVLKKKLIELESRNTAENR